MHFLYGLLYFLTKGFWSRNKAVLPTLTAPFLSHLFLVSQQTEPDTLMQVEGWSHIYWQIAIFHYILQFK